MDKYSRLISLPMDDGMISYFKTGSILKDKYLSFCEVADSRRDWAMQENI
jgi:hypothetical protein